MSHTYRIGLTDGHSQPEPPTGAKEDTTKILGEASGNPSLGLQRKKSSLENLKMEESYTNELANTHWLPNLRALKDFERHKRSLSLDLGDSIINFKDEDGHYSSTCDHSAIAKDHKCSCHKKFR